MKTETIDTLEDDLVYTDSIAQKWSYLSFSMPLQFQAEGFVALCI
jgi:hypothetical protein